MKNVLRDYKLVVQTLTQKVLIDNPGSMAIALKKVVSAEGAAVYQDVPRVAELLAAQGISNSAIKKVELVLCGSSLVRYLDQLSGGLSAIDINNIILTAERAGLSSKAARTTVADIMYSLSVPQLMQDMNEVDLSKEATIGDIYIPPAAYMSRINSIRNMLSKKESITENEFSELNAFARAGVPEAKTLLGRVYLQGLGVPEDKETALNYLKEASAHGDAEAYALLGDYYYGVNNKKAFELYSRPGALALDERRWERFRNLHKVRKFNNLQVILLLALAMAMELFMFVFNKSIFTGGHMVACFVCSAINCLVSAGILVVHFKDPYQDLRNLSLPFLVVFFIFAQILI